MPEQDNNNPNPDDGGKGDGNQDPNNNPGSGGAGDGGNGNGDGKGNDNPGGDNGGKVELTDEQLKAAFQHPRFKELNDKAKRADTLAQEKADADKKALEEQGKFKELAEKAEGDAKNWQQKYEQSTINNSVIAKAAAAGAQDPDTITRLINREKLTLNDDGTVEGVDDAIKEMQSSQPYLFKTGGTKNVGSGTNPDSGSGGDVEYKLSDYKKVDYNKDPELAKKMDKAMVEGRVDMNAQQ